jgi:peptidoglycan hydrolase-like protein with peptidoglycan-binding domain
LAASRSLGAAALAAVTLLSTGGATGFLLRAPGAPQALRGAAEATSAPVGREQHSDERTVKISLTRSTAPPLTVGFGGRVTATDCRPGAALRSGRAVARIDDTPLIALATSRPLYRDLTRGDKGADVRALQRELNRLGHDVTVDGTYRRSTSDAVKKLQKAAGVGKPDGNLAYGKILWLPAPSVVPESCELVLGADVSAGAPAAKAPAPLTAIAVDGMPPNLVAGKRILNAFGVPGPVNPDGMVTDPAVLRKVSATAEYRLVQASGKDPDLTAKVTLRDPLDTVKLPPGALFAVDGDAGCVESGTTTYPVRIVGSRLGASLVTMTGPAPTTVDLGSAITATECR